MNKTRLFIYKTPQIKNNTFEYTATTSGDYRDDWWIYPNGTSFVNGCVVPFPDNTNGAYAIRQNIGIEKDVVYLAITIDKWGATDGQIDIQIGNAHFLIDPNNYAGQEFPFTIDLQDLNIPLTVANGDPFLSFDLALRGSGGPYLNGNPVSGWGIKTIYLKYTSGENYKEVDLYDNIEVPVVYNVADVADITKKNSNFSLDFDVPNTQNNAELFDYIYEITENASPFEFLRQYPCFLEVENNRTFEGFFKITQVTINDNKEVSYKCNLYSNVLEFVKRLGTTTLRGNENKMDDLSFSEYTFGTPSTPFDLLSWFKYTDLFNWSNTTPIEPVSEKPFGKGCYFAVVDKMAIESNINRIDTSDPVYKGINIFFDELTPFIFYKEIWDKIFEKAGFSYVSDFLENNGLNQTGFDFERLAYPATQSFYNKILSPELYTIFQENTNRPLNDQIIGNNWVSPSMDITTTQPVFSDLYGNLGLTETIANSVQLNPSQITFSNAGIYQVDLKIPFAWNWWLTEEYDTSSYTLETTTSTEKITCSQIGDYIMTLKLMLHTSNGEQTVAEYTTGLSSFMSEYDANAGIISILDETWEWTGNVYVQATDFLYLEYDYRIRVMDGIGHGQFKCPAAIMPPWLQNVNRFVKGVLNIKNVDINDNLITVTKKSSFYIDGIFDPTEILNPERKKIDFFNDIVKKFNLYVEDVTDKKDDNGIYYRDYNTPNVRKGEPVLRIEPRDMFYDNRATVKDWTTRVVTDTIEFRRIDDYIDKILFLNDKDDNTYFVEDYNNYNYAAGEFGEKIYESEYNTSQEEKIETKTEIGQTMVVRPFSSKNLYLETPAVFSIENSGEVKKDKEFNDRMLFVYNVYSGNDPYNIYPYDFSTIFSDSALKFWRLYVRDNSDVNSFNNAIQPFSDSRGNPGPATMKTFCALNHLNEPFGKDYADINFGSANWYYNNLNGTWVTYNNAFYRFYSKMIEDYNDRNARIMTCYAYLTPKDIRDLQLSDTILINEVPYRVNKIEQWKNGNTATKCEFIKIIRNTSELMPVMRSLSNEKLFPKNKDKINSPVLSKFITPLTVKEEMNKKISEQNDIIIGLVNDVKFLSERVEKLEKK